ncbi:recombinase family protein [Pelagibius sp. Alg239-R121]|uniref:recombinase family protein n=1 Tax=Pelagibius sp. Alg239-R121 TaxID=2993448 RepID=UPI0024A754ED|nr:recombinase family protein [Pelagibius sp. Alg239-R121]
MKIGYARVSTKWHSKEVQIAALESEGCDRIWRENSSDRDLSQRQFEEFINGLKPDDTVITTRLTSIARSNRELVMIVNSIREKGAHFQSIAEPWINTNRPDGDAVLTVLDGLVNFEIDLLKASQSDEKMEPMAMGVAPGRPRKLTELQKYEAISLLRLGKSAAEIGRLFNVSRSTISRLKRV